MKKFGCFLLLFVVLLSFFVFRFLLLFFDRVLDLILDLDVTMYTYFCIDIQKMVIKSYKNKSSQRMFTRRLEAGGWLLCMLVFSLCVGVCVLVFEGKPSFIHK